MRIDYTIVDCPLGLLLIGATRKGVCTVYLGDSEEKLESELRDEYPAAEIRRDDSDFGPQVDALLQSLDGTWPDAELPLDVRATAFQRRVWEELMAIPRGETRTYGEIARKLDQPTAARAVARACATNPVSVVVPCHRVVRQDGGLGGYRWGLERKKALLEGERDAPPDLADET
jgi:AraC family transcriptional regulator of adaptative response/methylated-DNA-[protein]-cysteine methyltransferase